MSDKELREYLRDIVQEHCPTCAWGDYLLEGHITTEPTYSVIEFSNSGVGESYVLGAFQAKWPDRRIDMEVEGGCDSCGYGQRITISISGPAPWENQ